MLAFKAARNGDKCFIHYLPDGSRYSCCEVGLLSNRIANGLLAHGIVEGAALRHPAVLEAVVYPVRMMEQGGDDEMASSVVLREGASLGNVELAEFCGKAMH
jgi:hypothetical protein